MNYLKSARFSFVQTSTRGNFSSALTGMAGHKCVYHV